ncbi:hypothetical protein [Pseudomonas sp. TMP25]|uniref:hypothetical protein n=1 Tax=Pseudomonas sp. TMP25 TaxID=3136561 RepID=UPI003101326A
MKLRSVFIYFILFVSNQSFADELGYAREYFNTKTGELYWDLGAEVRIKFIPKCTVYTSSSYQDRFDTRLHKLMKGVDYFGIIRDYGVAGLACDSRGLSYIYLLSQSGEFQSLYEENSIQLDGEEKRYFYNENISGSEKYEPIHAALQKNQTEIRVTIPRTYSLSKSRPGFLDQQVSYLIRLSKLDEADKLSRPIALKEVERLNDLLPRKYLIILLINIILIASLVTLILLYKIKIHPRIAFGLKFVVKKINSLPANIARNFGGGSRIIKSEKMKSYSVADELLKWAKLKEDGLISEKEFQIARDKIMSDH